MEFKMDMNLWGFLSVFVVLGFLFAMFVAYMGHKKTMKQLEIEALATKNENSQAGVEKS
jgi:hypothetical protein